MDELRPENKVCDERKKKGPMMIARNPIQNPTLPNRFSANPSTVVRFSPSDSRYFQIDNVGSNHKYRKNHK